MKKRDGDIIWDLSGKWHVSTDEVTDEVVFLPGTLDENKIGHADEVAKPWHPDVEDRSKDSDYKENDSKEKEKRIASRLTRNFTYEGPARFTRKFEGEVTPLTRYFLRAERGRSLTLKVDGKEIPCISGSLSTPYVFEVTDYLKNDSLIELTSDNSYPDLPYKDIVFSSAATDESQTNWNGIIGKIIVEEKPVLFISDVLVYPGKDLLDIKVGINGDISACQGLKLSVESDNLKSPICKMLEEISADDSGVTWIFLKNLELSECGKLKKWDLDEGNLGTLTVQLFDSENDSDALDEKEISFGIRSFEYDCSGKITINERAFFLRSEANCAFFPETGHPPMDKEGWREIFETYHSYGINCVRFHSWCPPEAAFEAADEMGMLVQPELSHWNPRDAFSTEESKSYYEKELKEILRCYGNHPSFVMLTLGNELQSDETGVEFMHHLMNIAREMDSTRLYAWGSNNFYGENGIDKESDFYTSSNFGEMKLRACGNTGLLNTTYPETKKNYRDTMAALRKEYSKPVFSFEVGQYEVLPDFDEIDEFKGVTRADNLAIVRDKVKALGISEKEWKKRVEATGEMSLFCYREEVEAVLRTPEMSGISLLGLQDFTGQGTALVGMLNSHLRAKPFSFAEPHRFRSFFRDVVILLEMDRYTYVVGDSLSAKVKVANYGKEDLRGELTFELKHDRGEVITKGVVTSNDDIYKVGELTEAGTIKLTLNGIDRASKLEIQVSFHNISNDDYADSHTSGCNVCCHYPIWLYPDEMIAKPDCVYETEVFDESAEKVLEKGGIVYLTPPSTKEALPHSVKPQFSTDFWSVGTFPDQEGTMGQLIDKEHPLFKDFPTEFYTTWQWYPMAVQRAFVLPDYRKTIITEMDSFAKLRPMSQLFEAKCLNGRMLISSMGLQNLKQYPEARALLNSIYRYLSSDDFLPKDTLEVSYIKNLF